MWVAALRLARKKAISSAAGTGGRSIYPVNRVHPASVYRLRRYGVYRLIMYPDRWIGAFKGVDGNTYDRTGQRCH